MRKTLSSKYCLTTLLDPLGGRATYGVGLGALSSKCCLATLLDPLGRRTTYGVGLGALISFSTGLTLLLAAAHLPAQAQDRGLTARADALGGASWQSRFERDAPSALAGRAPLALGSPGLPVQSLRLLGDYQFSTFRLGDTGGLRLTGGLLVNIKPASSALPEASNGALPYAGIGYSSSSLRGDWGFSADLGLAAPGLSSARIDRLFNSAAAAAADAQPRLLPMIRLGMNVAF